MGFLFWGYGILTNSFFRFGSHLLFITGHDLQEEK